MKRIVLAIALSFSLSLPALADMVSLNTLSRYLTSIGVVETTFTQINADGSLSTGKLYIHRPGRMRFEYDPPDLGLVIAASGQLAVFDPVSDGEPAEYPLNRTPLNLILERQVDLSQSDMVIAHSGDATATRVVAQDPRRPELGTIELVFSSDPVELRQWIITGEDGQATTVILGAMQPRDSLSAFLFDIAFEAQQRRDRR